ncbi:MAG: glutamate--tRNA ligase [Desulfohalobiaceae bacterium]|nr:glutamate--tRNA ligase [Desulfohalobiaceae bacterium]
MSNIVTRFPPSPTGHLHIGGARTALFNWLYARCNQGKFILRIEDTDTERSTREMTDSILEAMDWLGLDWDEGPYFQSERLAFYQEQIEALLESGLAYYCGCTPEEVEAMRKEAWEKGEKPKYNGRCRDLGLGPGPGRVVRLKAPLDGQTVFQDLIKGINAVDNRELDDFILRRADNTPTYNLAVVVDDALMGVTCILRGDDHISNTPKQVMLYQALGFALPDFGHVPMILGPDKKRLSKRHGAMSVLEYREQGYLPEALINYLVRLGWSHGDQELFSREELVDKFSLKNLGKSACIFNPEKLDWVNSQHIKSKQPAELAGPLVLRLQNRGLSGLDRGYAEKIVPLLQPRVKTLEQLAEQAVFFVLPDQDLNYDREMLETCFTPEIKGYLQELLAELNGLEDFSRGGLEQLLGEFLKEKGIKFKLLAQPIRIALSGKKASPGLFETMEVLGRERVLNRLGRVLEMLDA